MLYRSFAGHGHNIRRNGVASAMYARASIRYYAGKTILSLEDSADCLNELEKTPRSRLRLYAGHLNALCRAHLGGEENLRKAKGKLVEVLKVVDHEPTVIYAKCLWALGFLKAQCEEDPEAEYLEVLSILDGLSKPDGPNYGREITALLAYITDAYKDDPQLPRKLQRAIQAVSADMGRRGWQLKSYLRSQAAEIVKLWSAATRRLPSLPEVIAAVLSGAKAELAPEIAAFSSTSA